MQTHQTNQVKIFFLIAFGFNFFMAIPLYFAKSRAVSLEIYPILMMLMPAAGVMASCLVTRKDDPNLPKNFFLFYLAHFSLIAILAIIYPFSPQIPCVQIANITLFIFSIVSWIIILKNRGIKNKAYGINTGKLGSVVAVCTLFILLYFLRIVILNFIDTGKIFLFENFSPFHIFLLILIIPNFFLSYSPFFGEEYGWRYFLQPILQKRFGMIRGIFLLGLIWGLWHAPLNFLFYSAEGYGLQSLISQIGTCTYLSIFMAFAYQKTNSIWSVSIIHYLNNNMIPFSLPNTNNPNSALQGVEFPWTTVAINWIVGLVLFGLFIFIPSMKNPKNRVSTLDEGADARIVDNGDTLEENL